MEFIDLDLVFSVISAIAAGIVYGFAGFGAAYVLIPLFSLIYGAREAVAVVMIMVTLGSVGLVFNTARHVAWRQIGPMSVLAMLTIPVGSLILLTVDPELMRRAIGAVILVLAAALLMGDRVQGSQEPDHGRRGGHCGWLDTRCRWSWRPRRKSLRLVV